MNASVWALLKLAERCEAPQKPAAVPAPQPDYPCYECGAEATHEIVHRGAPLDVCDSCDLNNCDGAPYCSYGHKTKASCDCGRIAENE